MFPPNPSMMPMGPSGGSPMGPPVAGSSPQSKGLGGMFGGDAVGRRGFKDFLSSTASRGGMMPGGAPAMMPSAPPGGMPMPVAPPMGGAPMMAPPIGGMGPMGPMGPMGSMGPQPMGMGPMGQPPMGAPMMQPPMMQPRPMGASAPVRAGVPVRFADGGAVPMRTEIRGMPHDLSYITADEAEILELLGGTGERGPGGIRAYPPVNEGGSTGTSDRGSFNDDKRDYGGYDPIGSIDGGQFDSGGIDTSPSYGGGRDDDWGDGKDDNWDDPFSNNFFSGSDRDDNDRGRDYGGFSRYDPIGSTIGSQFSGGGFDFGPVYGGGDDRDGFFADEDSVFSQPVVSAAVSAGDGGDDYSSPVVSVDRDDRADVYDFGGDIYRDTDFGGSALRSPSSGFAPESGIGLGPSSRPLEVARGVSPSADVDLGVSSPVLGALAGDDLLDLLGDVDAGRVFAPGTQVAQNMLTQSDMDYLSEVTGRPYPSSALGTPISDEEQKYLDKRADDLAKAAQKKAAADPNWGTALGIPDVDLSASGVTTLPSVDVDSLAPSLTNMPDEAMLPSGIMPSPVREYAYFPSADGGVSVEEALLGRDQALHDASFQQPSTVARPNVDVTDDYRADRREIYTEPGLGDVEYMLSISGDLPGFQAGPLEDYVTDVEDRFLETRSDRRDFEEIPPSPSVVTAPEAAIAPVPPDAVVTESGAIVTGMTADQTIPEGMAGVYTGYDPNIYGSFEEYRDILERGQENTPEEDMLPSGIMPMPADLLAGDQALYDAAFTPPMTTSGPPTRSGPRGVDGAAPITVDDAAPITVDDAYGAYPADSVVTPPTDAEVVAEMERSGLSYEDAYKQLMAERSGLSQFGTGVLELLGNAFIPGAGTAGVAALEKQREKRAEEIAYDISIGGEPVYNRNGDLIGVVDLAGVYNGFTYGTGFDADGNRLGDDYQESIRDAIPSTEDNLFGDGADERDCPEGYTFDRILRQCVPVEEAGDTGDTGEGGGDGEGDGTGGGTDDEPYDYSLTPIQQPEFYTSLYNDVGIPEMDRRVVPFPETIPEDIFPDGGPIYIGRPVEPMRSGGPVTPNVDRFMASFG